MNIRNNLARIRFEMKSWFCQVFALKNSWLLLPGVAGILLVYVLQGTGWLPVLLERDFHENLALGIMPVIVMVLFVKGATSRDSLVIYLAGLALIFLVRELDDTALSVLGGVYKVKTKKLVELLLLGLVLWGVYWQDRLFASLNRFVSLKIALFGMFWTYFLSQLIARRAFRHILPSENLLNVAFEETGETIAHLIFLVVAICLCRIVPRRRENLAQSDVLAGSMAQRE